MIGCNLLLQISEALTAAKGDTSAFGGINLNFAGDFVQLGPVGQTCLFGHVNTPESNTTKGQRTISGKLLWLSVHTVVILTENKQQSGPGSERFVSLLHCLWEGKFKDKDYELLSSCVVHRVKPDWSYPSWTGVPIIMPIVLSAQQMCFPCLDYFLITESVWPNKNFVQSNSDDSNVDMLFRFI